MVNGDTVTTRAALSSNLTTGLGGVSSDLPLPRIGIIGKQLTRSGQEFKAWGYQQLSYAFEKDFFIIGGEEERATATSGIYGDRLMGANVIRVHVDLWWFIEGPDKDSLVMTDGPLSNLLFFIDVCRQNSIYVLINANNTWYPQYIPSWFDDLDYRDRWDVSAFHFAGMAGAIVDAGLSSTILGYELAGEPTMSINPAHEWYGDDVFGVGVYFRNLIARGPDVDGDTVRDWIVQLRDAIKAVDPEALVTFGALPYYWTHFGYENTQDLLDFVSPHLYPPFEILGQTSEEQVALVNGWEPCTIPIVTGETFMWSALPENNMAQMDAILPISQGVISFSYGYSPEEFTSPPELPKYPADPTLSDAIYQGHRGAIELFNTYRAAFLADTEPLPTVPTIRRGVLSGAVSTRRTLGSATA